MSRTRTSLRARAARVVALVLVGVVALTGCDFSVYSLPLPGGADLGDDPYTVKVEFRDVLDLVPQSSVKVDDVSVGRVEEIEVQDYTALVTLKLRKSVKLPDDAVATIRQTSLLGEKFVSLAAPTRSTGGRLGNGDTIPLERSGRNPEVEEVLGALSLLLNGGGVAQLKMISSELNKALEGRESDVRSVLRQLDGFMGQLDDNKAKIVAAIESLNRLAIALNRQEDTIKLTLDQLPDAVASVNKQRDDLVEMLDALSDLSGVATRVITQSKTATVDSLRALAPTLNKLAAAGQSLPDALQVFLTYPFVDAVVGENPRVARNLHMGDYTNLSVQLDIDLSGLTGLCDTLEPLKELPIDICNNPALAECVDGLLQTTPEKLTGNPVQVLNNILESCGDVQGQVCALLDGVPTGELGALPGLTDLKDEVCGADLPAAPGLPNLPLPNLPVLTDLQKCLRSGKPLGPACDKVNPAVLVARCAPTNRNPKPQGYNSDTCRRYRQLDLGLTQGGVLAPLAPGNNGGGGNGGGGGGLPGGLGLPGLGRAPFGAAAGQDGREPRAADSELGAMLVWGMVQR